MSLLFTDDLLLPDLSLSFGFEMDLAAMPRVAYVPKEELRLFVTIVPDQAAVSAQQSVFRFKADETELGISAFTLDNPISSTGQKLDVTLTDPASREIIKAAESFTLEHGATNLQTGEIIWQDLFAGNILSGTNLSIGFGDRGAADQLSISTLAPLTTKLGKAPESNVTFYDPYRIQIDEESELVPDTAGNTIPDEFVKVGFLSLHKLFELIFVDRCGFSGFKTNLPDERVRVCTIRDSETYFQGLAPHIGIFDPLTFEKDGEIWILDATMSHPDGFPEPRELLISNYKQLSITETFENIDGFIVAYSETDAGLSNYFVIRTETDTEESGKLFDETYSKTKTVRTYKDFKNNPDSQKITSSQLWKEEKTITDTFGWTLAKTSLVREFDGFGREKSTTKTVWNKVPDVPLSTDLVLKEVKKEIYEVTYSPHPFERGKQYISKTVRSISGLIAIDANNQYLEKDFEQDFIEAHRAGNIQPDFETKNGAIRKIIQIMTPQPDGTVSTEVITEDLIRKITTRSDSESKSGDIGLSSQTSKTRRIRVFPSDDYVRTGKPLRELFVAELSLDEAVALARRKLSKSELGDAAASVDKAGVDLSIGRGTIMTLKGRSGTNYGKTLFEGWRLSGTALGTINQKTSTQVQGVIIR